MSLKNRIYTTFETDMNLNDFILATTAMTITMVIIKANKTQKLRYEKDNILYNCHRIITGIKHILTYKITLTFSDFC